MHFEHEHEFAATVERVAATMSDPSFQVALALPDLAPPEVVVHEVDGPSRRLTLRYEYTGRLDPIAQRVVGGRSLTWMQELRIDVASGAGTLVYSADGLGGRAEGRAAVTLTAVTPTGTTPSGDVCRRRISGDLRIGIPVLGGTAERAIVPGLVRRLDVEAEALARELAR